MHLKDIFSEAKGLKPPETARMMTKSRLMERIGAKSSDLSALAQAEQLANIEPSEHFRRVGWMRLKARMIEVKSSVWQSWVRFFKKLMVYGTLTSLIMFGVFSHIALAPPPIIEAKAVTYLLILNGSVDIKHLGGEWVEASDYEILRSLDTIRTGPNTKAEIHFFDSSVTRLAPNTQLVIKTLKEHPSITKTGFVNLYLEHGSLWTKALNIKDSDSQIVVETDACTVSSHQATFFVASSPNTGTEVVTYDRVVDVKGGKDTEQLQEGYRVTFADNKVVQEKVSNDTNLIVSDWVQENLDRDEQFEQDLVKDTIEVASKEAGVLPTAGLYYNAKLLQEKTQAIFSDSDASQFAVLKESASKRLNEAASLLANNNADMARSVLYHFSDLIDELVPLIQSDPALQVEIETLLKDREQHFLAINHLNSLLYPVKEAIQEARTKIVSDETNKQLVRMEIASDALHEVRDLLAENRSDLAGVEVKKVRDMLSNIDASESDIDDERLRQQTMAEEVIPVVSELVDDVKDRQTEELGALVQDLQATENAVRIMASETSSTITSEQMVFTVDMEPQSSELMTLAIELPAPTPIVAKNSEQVTETVDREYVLEKFLNSSAKLQTAKQEQQERVTARVEEFNSKIEIFNTLRARTTQAETMLSKIANDPKELSFLYQLRNKVDIRVRNLINQKIKLIESNIQ